MTEPASAITLPMTRLVPWLRAHLPASEGDIAAEKFAGGQSNPTYKLYCDGEPRWVLRKRPDGPLLPSAHAIDREYRVTRALSDSAVPVARPIAYCEDTSIIGTAFFVMEYIEGRNFWRADLPELDNAQRAAVYDEMNRVLGELHRIDPAAVGLADFGKPGDYFARQIARWSKQYRASATESIAAIERLIEWLPAHNPGLVETRIVHGDYRNDNMIFAAAAPRIRAVLDWELSTLGHPLADLAQFLIQWRLPSSYRGLADIDIAALGIPSAQQFAARYAERNTALTFSDEHLQFALVFALFRNACIRQGVFKRALDGNASSAQALVHGARARAVAELAWRIAAGERDAVLASEA